MAVLNDLNRLIHRSHISFNEAREKDTSTLDSERPSISSLKPIKRNLSQHNLRGVFFFGCVFEKVSFGSLVDTSFNGCKFIECDFGPAPTDRTKSPKASEDVVFFECEFYGGSFARQRMQNWEFIDPVFEYPVSFEGAVLEQRFVYHAEIIDQDFLDALANAETSARSDVQIIGNRNYPKISWETIRFVSKLPFLQVSFVGIVAVAALAVLVGSIEEPFASLSQRCEVALQEHPDVQSVLGRVCGFIPELSLTNGILDALQIMFLNFLMIFIGAFIQTTKCPNEVTEFSKTYWVRQLRRPQAFYQALAQRERCWMFASAIFQAVGICFFLYKAGSAFLSTFG